MYGFLDLIYSLPASFLLFDLLMLKFTILGQKHISLSHPLFIIEYTVHFVCTTSFVVFGSSKEAANSA